ncbi:MAG: alpha/beta hydrolase [Psychroflexus salarius]|jgi:hypothetical protein
METQVFMMPGMAANPTIFEHIKLPDEFKVHWLDWLDPLGDESLESYAKRLSEPIPKNDEVVLIGVSFGGIIVQEIHKLVNAKKVIIISSVKHENELPPRMKIARDTGVYKVLPTGVFNYLEQIDKLPLGDVVKKRIQLYKTYMSMSNKHYLDWAIKRILNWEQTQDNTNFVHIHGDQDGVFPIKYIKGCVTIEGGTHLMILNRFRWFNEHLPNLIN